MRRLARLLCLACGESMPPVLRHAASLRCHDCLDADAPIRADLVDPNARV
jgi:hypothetical protein